MRRTLIVAALCGVVAVVGAVVLIGGSSQAQDFDLDGVTADTLEGRGITLERPDTGDSASIDEQRAIDIALATGHGPDVRVREAVLATLKRDGPFDGRLVWVINYDPQTVEPFPLLQGEPGSEQQARKIDYLLEFVDAKSGEFLFGTEQGAAPPLPD